MVTFSRYYGRHWIEKFIGFQGVDTTNSPVEPSATGIKIKSSDQGFNLH